MKVIRTDWGEADRNKGVNRQEVARDSRVNKEVQVWP